MSEKEEIRLSDEQLKIVRHPPDKHAVVLAVAGSGKSATLVERIARLQEAHRVPPSQIIAVMFNKAAADEMAERLEKRLGKRNAPLSVTYHRLGTLTLRMLIQGGLAPAWKFDASPTAATKFAIEIVQPFTDALGIKYPRYMADAFLGFVDRVKGDLADPDQVFEDGEWSENQKWFPVAYKAYEEERAERGIRFFSDLIYDPVMICQSDPRAAKLVGNRFAHIVVDEYQDICESQQALIKVVAGTRARVMVVGDDDQTIYTWRGAKPSYILRDFKKDFVGAETYKLSRTWRYGHNISCAANYLITNNKDRSDKLCISGPNVPSSRIHLVQGNSESIIKSLRPVLKSGVAYGQVAILVRAYSRSGTAQLELLKYGVPFRLEGGEKVAVLENMWVKMLIGWLRVAAGDIAAQPYVGEVDFGSIMELKEVLANPWLKLDWEAHTQLCRDVLTNPKEGRGFSVYEYNHVKNDDLKARLRHMGSFWRSVLSMGGVKGLPAYEFFMQVCTHFDFENRIKMSYKCDEDAEMNIELVRSFLQYAKQYEEGDAISFIDHIANLKSFSDRAKNAVDAVHITSVHRSKGLEWDVVFMIGLEQGKFPLTPKKKMCSVKAAQHLEDERRLFYVAMTRARHHLFLVAPLDNGVEEDREAAKDLDADYVAPKVDGLLRMRLLGGNSTPPYSLTDAIDTAAKPLSGDKEEKPALPSQFIYEANIFLAGEMREFLIDKKAPKRLQAADPELFNAYLEAVGSKRRASKIRG